MAAAAKIVVPTPEVSPATIPEATSKGKSKERRSDSQAASFEPAKKKEKIPMPELRSWNQRRSQQQSTPLIRKRRKCLQLLRHIRNQRGRRQGPKV